ncbi:MAG: hypothetical protein R2830_15430 [Saprospiraceae bacterium]
MASLANQQEIADANFLGSLSKVLTIPDKITWSQFHFFLKGDISGIQDFIFSVKSRRASRTLKGRSFFIHTLSELCINLIKEKVGVGNVEVFYNGGGNFYLLLKQEYKHEIDGVRKIINEDCGDQEFYVNISVTKSSDILNSFPEIWKDIHDVSDRDKLQRYRGYPNGFSPYQRSPITEPIQLDGDDDGGPFSVFARRLVKSDGWEVRPDENKPVGIGASGIQFFNNHYRLSGKNGFENIVYELPEWTAGLKAKYNDLIEGLARKNIHNPEWKRPKVEDIIEFEYLAAFAGERTGTTKLGILKMDVDNLGKLFSGRKNAPEAKKVSAAMSWFFGDHLKALLDEPFNEVQFKDNIYVVFAGGDDCFFLGGWDAVFEFATRLHNRWELFEKTLKGTVKSLPDNITLSAGLIMVGPKFPVSRFAHLAEEALGEAKSRETKIGTDKNEERIERKNAINVFGKTLSWSAFKEAGTTAHNLEDLIKNKGENRAILERLQRESVEFENLKTRNSETGIINGRSTWRLLYSVRRTAQEKNLEALTKIAREYANALVDSFVKGEPVETPDLHKVPVAARWAEFLTRNSKPKP